MTRVIVCGSRTWSDYATILSEIAGLALELPPPLVIVHGDAQGADRLAARAASSMNLRTEAHPAQWGTYGKRAGPIRNKEMAALGAELVLAFWDGSSRGTRHMIREAERRAIEVRIIEG
jgi:hypothetical protein